jgi:hypothetical protein
MYQMSFMVDCTGARTMPWCELRRISVLIASKTRERSIPNSCVLIRKLLQVGRSAAEEKPPFVVGDREIGHPQQAILQTVLKKFQ